jgi:decaprenyl-phosphate phosphoribosyltransferase
VGPHTVRAGSGAVEVDAGAPTPSAHRPAVTAWLVALRPKQWVKNLLVLSAPGAAGIFDEWDALGRSAVAIAVFCCVAGGMYLLNDAADVDADRSHPTKRRRPIAAGEVSVGAARIVGVVLAALGLAVGFGVLGAAFGAIVSVYVAQTVAYSLWLKHIPVVDIVTIASGFALRAIAGAFAVDVPVSNWFFIVSSFGSLFVIAGKRAAELRDIGPGAGTRAVLASYDIRFLEQVTTMAAGVVVVSYCLWAFERAQLVATDIPWIEASTAPFTTAVLRYVYLLSTGRGAAPEDVLLHDRVLLALGGMWAALVFLGIEGVG